MGLNALPKLLFNALRGVFGRIGLELRRARPTHEEFPRLAYFLNQRRVDTVLDVGANRGQFAKALFESGYAGRIISFEPIPELHRLLLAEADRVSGGRWVIAPSVALSDQTGSHSFAISGNLASSSLLPVLPVTTTAAPETVTTRTIEVSTRPLDAIYADLPITEPVFLKLDTQGAEAAILRGAAEALKKILGVKIELSLTPLYEGQACAHELDTLLREGGFQCWDVIPGFRNRSSGQLLQYDGVYFRP